jgi:hypothetical protein
VKARSCKLWLVNSFEFFDYTRFRLDALPANVISLSAVCTNYEYHSDSTGQARRRISSKQKCQHKPRQKAADVRHVSDATRLRCIGNGTDAAKKL